MGRLQLLLVPPADPAGRERETKQAGYWVRKGIASAGSWAGEGAEHHPRSVQLAAAGPASQHPGKALPLHRGSALGAQGWFCSWLPDPAEPP